MRNPNPRYLVLRGGTRGVTGSTSPMRSQNYPTRVYITRWDFFPFLFCRTFPLGTEVVQYLVGKMVPSREGTTLGGGGVICLISWKTHPWCGRHGATPDIAAELPGEADDAGVGGAGRRDGELDCHLGMGTARKEEGLGGGEGVYGHSHWSNNFATLGAFSHSPNRYEDLLVKLFSHSLERFPLWVMILIGVDGVETP